jgi:tetratricopeptide (TPR) repeat protein
MALYDGFISYSHAKDKPIAAALQSAIQKLGKPWYRRRALRLFRDDTSLSATPQLWPSIERALGQSRFFVLLASPESAASPWVGKEAAYWIDRNGTDTLLIGVTDGELRWDEKTGDFAWNEATPLPAVLAGRFKTEPKWVDLRPYRHGADQRDSRFIELGADFAAAIHGTPKEDLLSQEVRQQRRALTLALATAALMLVIASFAAVETKIARDNAARANQNFLATKQVTVGLANNLRNVRGITQEITGLVLNNAAEAVAKLYTGNENQDIVLLRSELDTAFANTSWFVGDIVKARDYVDQGIALDDQILRSTPDAAARREALQDRYAALMLQGDIVHVQGEFEAAVASFRAAQASAQAIVDRAPNDKPAALQLAAARGRIGDILRQARDYGAAVNEFDAIASIQQKFLKESPDDADWLNQSSWNHNRLGDTLLHITAHEGLMTVAADRTPIFKYDADAALALDHYQHSVDIRRKLVADQPSNNERRRDLIWSLALLGMASLATDTQQAWTVLDDGRGEAEQLLKTDPKNTEWLRYLALIRNFRGDDLLLQGRTQEAFAEYDEGLRIRQNLSDTDPKNARWRRDLFYTYVRMSKVSRIAGDVENAEDYRGRALKLAEPVRLGFPTDRVLADAIVEITGANN